MKKTILITFIATLIGLLIGVALANLDQDGKFTSWRLINSAIKFRHIISATTGSIQVEASDNNTYSHTNTSSTEGCSGWNEKACPTNSLLNEEMVMKNGTCMIDGIKYPTNPEGKVFECVRTTGDTGDGIFVTTYYALLEDGSIWVWNYDNLSGSLRFPVVSMFYGFLVGVLISVVFYYLEKSKNKKQATIISDH